MLRLDNRALEELRAVKMTPSWSRHAEGSCLVELGNTKVLCTASIEEKVPPWMKNSGKGWVTGEYGMLPRSTHSRKPRDAAKGKLDGRSIEIQRLIGRSLRSVVDMRVLGERQVILDCDVLQADGGTRCAAITGAWVALSEAIAKLVARGVMAQSPIKSNVAAVSVGLLAGGHRVLDLAYEEDSGAEADMNVVMDGTGGLIEVQATGEQRPFSREELNALLDLAQAGISQLVALQNGVVKNL
jgi:ribonuclease PH